MNFRMKMIDQRLKGTIHQFERKDEPDRQRDNRPPYWPRLQQTHRAQGDKSEQDMGPETPLMTPAFTNPGYRKSQPDMKWPVFHHISPAGPVSAHAFLAMA
jgi:hypothetical protein